MGQFSNPVAIHPRTNEVEVPPAPKIKLSSHISDFYLAHKNITFGSVHGPKLNMQIFIPGF